MATMADEAAHQIGRDQSHTKPHQVFGPKSLYNRYCRDPRYKITAQAGMTRNQEQATK